MSSLTSELIITMAQTLKKTPVLIKWTLTHFFFYVYRYTRLALALGNIYRSNKAANEASKNRMPARHRQLSVSAALPNTGSALSDKYKHSRPGPAFLSQRQWQQHSAHWLAVGEFCVSGTRCWRDALSLRQQDGVIVSETAETLSLWVEISMN